MRRCVQLVLVVGLLCVGAAFAGVSVAHAQDELELILILENNGGLSLPHGTDTALQAKVDAALQYVSDNDLADGCASLNAYTNYVQAMEGKKISVSDGQFLVQSATELQADFGCFQAESHRALAGVAK